MPLNPAVLHHDNYTTSVVIAHRATSAGSTVLPQQLNAWLNASQLVVKMADFDRDGDLDYQCLDYRGVNVTKGDDFAPFPTRPCYMCRCDRITRDLVHGLMCDEKFCPSCLSLTRPAYDACCAKTCIYMYIAGAAILSMLIGLCLFGIWQNTRRWRNNNARAAGTAFWPPGRSTTSPATAAAGQSNAAPCAAGIPVFVFHRSDGVASVHGVVHSGDVSTTTAVHTIYSPTSNNNNNSAQHTNARHQPNYAAFLNPSQLATVAAVMSTQTDAAGAALQTHNGSVEEDEQRQAPPSYWTVLSGDVAHRQGEAGPSPSNSGDATLSMVLVRGTAADKPDITPLAAAGGLPHRSESPPPRYEDLVLSTSSALPNNNNNETAACSSSSSHQ